MPWWIWELVGSVVTLTVAVLAWWVVPKWQVNRLSPEIQDPKDRANLEDNYRKTVGQLLGMVIALLAAGLAYNQTLNTLQGQSEASLRAAKAARELQDEQQAARSKSDFVKRQLDTWSNSLLPFNAMSVRPEVALNDLLLKLRLGFFLDENTIEDLSRLYDSMPPRLCHDELSPDCLRALAMQENIIRRGISLPPISASKFQQYLSSGGDIDRINAMMKSGDFRDFLGTVREPSPLPPPPPPQQPVEEQPPAVAPKLPCCFFVYFDLDQSTLTDRARQIIGEAANVIARVNYRLIEVNGYTDRSGTPQQNQRLSVSHAQAVADELVKDGVPKDAIVIHGFGSTHLAVPTAPGVSEPQNRRAEILIH